EVVKRTRQIAAIARFDLWSGSEQNAFVDPFDPKIESRRDIVRKVELLVCAYIDDRVRLHLEIRCLVVKDSRLPIAVYIFVTYAQCVCRRSKIFLLKLLCN